MILIMKFSWKYYRNWVVREVYAIMSSSEITGIFSEAIGYQIIESNDRKIMRKEGKGMFYLHIFKS